MPKVRMFPLRANNVLELFRQRGLINLEPAYQRLSVWDNEKQGRFIDSIINGIDTPKLYFHDLSGLSRSNYRFSVIDGKQRILALWAFIEDQLQLPLDFRYFENDSYHAAGLTYSQLLNNFPLLRARFDNFELPIILVQADTEEFIEQLFWRLNVQVPLTAPEKRNVLGGPLPLLIRRIGLTPFFTDSVRISNRRFQHYDLAAKFIYVCHADGFVTTKKGNLDSFVLSMKRARERSEEIASDGSLMALESRTRKELETACTFFGPNNPLLASIGRVALYFHLFRLCSNANRPFPLSLRMLEKFNADVTFARRKSQRMARGSGEKLTSLQEELLRFDIEKQSTNDANALRRQYESLRHYMLREFQVKLPQSD